MEHYHAIFYQVSNHSRANIPVPNRKVFNILEEEVKAVLRGYESMGIEGKTMVQKNGCGAIELTTNLDSAAIMQMCLGRIGALTQGNNWNW